MGTWVLEVAKMTIYVMFPVALFHYFNQPKYFEEWVINKKQELYPPETEATREFQNTLAKIKREQDMNLLKGLEEK